MNEIKTVANILIEHDVVKDRALAVAVKILDKIVAYTDDEVGQIMLHQDAKVGELTRKNERLQDSYEKRQDWLRKAKAEAGFDDSVSFDVVWEKVLKVYKSQTS